MEFREVPITLRIDDFKKYLEQYHGKIDAVEYVFNEDGMKTEKRRWKKNGVEKKKHQKLYLYIKSGHASNV